MATNPYVLDFSGPQNMLSRYHQAQMQQRSMDQQQGQFDQSNILARESMGQADRHFNASNMLAQRSADRADQLAPGQLELQKAQIAHARAQGASEMQLAPLMLQIKQNEARLAQAKAEGKDTESMILREMFGGGQPAAPQTAPPGYAPGVRPQSFNDPAPGVPGVQPVADVGGGDPNLILTQGATPPPVVQPQAPQTARDVIQNMDPARRAQFGMAWMGKGEAAKVLGEAANADKLSKEARNKIDEKELNAVESVARIKEIASAYKPEFLTYEGRAKQYGISWLDSFDATRKRLPPDVVQSHEEFTRFRRSAVSNMNLYIKEITGAAMSELEADRLRKAIADAQNDNPRAFETKLKAAAREAELTVGRMRYLRANGFTGDATGASARLPVPEFQRMIENETRSLFQQLRNANPGADETKIRGAVRQQIRTKFGLDA